MKTLAPIRAVLLAGALITAGAALAARPPAYIVKAVAAMKSDPDMTSRRHPVEIAAFAGVKRGDKVADLIPGSYGYFTRLFSGIVGPRGRVYGVWPNEYDPRDLPPYKAVLADYPNVTLLTQPAADFSVPEKVDLVFTSQNYHDYPDKFMGRVDPMVLNREVYKALKPGGVFLVIDHAGAPGTGMTQTETLHRIDPAIVKSQVTAAGFVYEGELDVLRNPADDHTLLVFDKRVRGKTDQFIFKFRKPRKG